MCEVPERERTMGIHLRAPATAGGTSSLQRRTDATVTLRHAAATEAILQLAATQHGVVTRAQLLAAGVTRDAVGQRIACRLLVPLHRGVYAVGLPVSAQGRAMA